MPIDYCDITFISSLVLREKLIQHHRFMTLAQRNVHHA